MVHENIENLYTYTGASKSLWTALRSTAIGDWNRIEGVSASEQDTIAVVQGMTSRRKETLTQLLKMQRIAQPIGDEEDELLLEEFFDETDLDLRRVTMDFLKESVNGNYTFVFDKDNEVLYRKAEDSQGSKKKKKKDSAKGAAKGPDQVHKYFRLFGYSDPLKLLILKSIQDDVAKARAYQEEQVNRVNTAKETGLSFYLLTK